MKAFYRKKRNQSGAALLVILSVSVLIIPLIQGVWLDSQVEYQFHHYRMNQLQARYNAKSGMGLSLLRLNIFKGIEKSLPKSFEPLARPILDHIWLFPFVWPMPPSEDMLESEKQDLKSLINESFLKGVYSTSIHAEDGLLDIGDLSSPWPDLRNLSYDLLLNLLLKAVEKQKELKDRYDQAALQDILNNISDWTDQDNESQNGGDEDLVEKGNRPLNRSFISIDEIKKVPGITPEIFEILKDHITVYGSKALNINYVGKSILEALNISPLLADEILSRTQSSSENYQPFLDQKAFCHFMNERGLDFCPLFQEMYENPKVLRFDWPIAFRIKSIGGYKGQSVRLEALLYDLSSVALNWQKALLFEKNKTKEPEEGPPSPQEKRATEEKKNTEEKKIDYSYHKSLIIMYLKESKN